MKRCLLVLIATLVMMTLSSRARAQSCANGSDDTISQHGVTITLDQSYTCGRFANGTSLSGIGRFAAFCPPGQTCHFSLYGGGSQPSGNF